MKIIIKIIPVFFLTLLACCFGKAIAQHAGFKNANETLHKRLPGDPLAHLPANMHVLTAFGERADISPDNKQVAFMAKTFGDAMVIDIDSREINCLTCNIPAAAFLRVMHLSTGDYLLIGPDRFEDPVKSKLNADLWFLSKKAGSKPVKIGQKVNEGLAISKLSLKIAYTELGGSAQPNYSKLVVADLDISGDIPKLINKKTVVESNDNTCKVEAQDFYQNDLKLTFFCYVPNGAFDVQGVDLKTLAVTNFSNAPNGFNEPEGIFPDGKYIAVEMDRQCEWLGGGRGSGNLDIWKLQLDGTGKNMERLTNFNDYVGGKAANPVVATNGKFMVFQVGRSADPPGMGHGLVVLRFEKQTRKKNKKV